MCMYRTFVLRVLFFYETLNSMLPSIFPPQPYASFPTIRMSFPTRRRNAKLNRKGCFCSPSDP